MTSSRSPTATAATTWCRAARRSCGPRAPRSRSAQIKRARDAREIRGLDHAREIKAELEKLVGHAAGARRVDGGRLFGSVTAADIVNAVKDAGGPLLDRKRVQVPGHIKTVGEHTVTIDLHPDVLAVVPVAVTAA